MMGADHLRKVAGYDFHDLRRKYDVRTMWGDLDPQWRLLQSQLVARGPGWYSPAELKERLFTNKSKRPGDDLKEALRTDDDTLAWQAWHVAHDLIWQSCRPGPPLVFPGEKELIRAMYDQIGKEEQVISPPYTRTPLDASMRGRKKRLQCAVRHSFIPGSWSAWIAPVQALLLLLDDVLVGTNRLARKASHFTSLVLLLYLTPIYSPWKEASIIQLQSWLFQNQWGSH